jgi:hypothetical protein
MKMKNLLTICGIAAALAASVVGVSAQTNPVSSPIGSDNANPAQQRFLQHVHDGLGLTNESDWNAIQPLVQNVYAAQRDLLPSTGVSRVPSLNRVINGTNSVGTVRTVRRVAFGPSTPEAQALQQAVDENASADDIKAALAAYHAAQKAKREKLEAAQESLRQALTPQQEARATLLKVLD